MFNDKEIWMEAIHGRKSKCKTEFKAVINKVLISTLVLTTVLGTATPAFAANVPYNNYPSTGYTQEYGISVEAAISNIENTIAEINRNRANGSFVDSKLKELSSQLYQLQTAVELNGGTVDAKVISVLNETEKTVNQIGSSASNDAKVALTVVKSMLGVDSVTVENRQAALKSFSDVPESYWGYKAIMLCVQHGAVTGTVSPDENGVGMYNPEGKVTLGQFLTVVTRLVCPDKIESANGGHWASGNYIAAVRAGIIRTSDFGSSKEDLDAYLSREDMAYILVRAAAVNGEDLQEKAGINQRIKDYNTISGNRQTYVLKAYSNGLIAGDPNGNFSPDGTTTRAQMATVVCRLMEYEARPEVQDVVESPIEQEIQDNSYIYAEGPYAGKLRIEYADQNAKAFYTFARFYTDANGLLALRATAPNVPDVVQQVNAKYSIGIMVYDKDDNYLFSTTIYDVLPGQSMDKTLTDEWGDGVRVSDIGYATLGFECYTDAGTMKVYDSSSNWGTAIIGQVTDDNKTEKIECNTVQVYEGIGLKPIS